MSVSASVHTRLTAVEAPRRLDGAVRAIRAMRFAAGTACATVTALSEAVQGLGVTLAFCWAHVRRDFIHTGGGEPWREEWLDRIGMLYRINRPMVRVSIGMADEPANRRCQLATAT